jgi:hypothetical protein
VEFAPLSEGYKAGHLDFGPDLPRLPLFGLGSVGTLEWQIPISLSLGPVAYSMTTYEWLRISNTGTVPIPLEPVLPDSCRQYELGGPPWPDEIVAGQTVEILVRFTPDTFENSTCRLSLGPVLPDVELVGLVLPPRMDFRCPTQLEFGLVAVEHFETRSVRVQNVGSAILPLRVELPDTSGIFFLVSGGGDIQLNPGDSHWVQVGFRPEGLIRYSTLLRMGDVVPPVQLFGTGRDPGLDWEVPAEIDFGEVPVHYEDSRYFSILNSGEFSIPIDVQIPDSCGAFTLTEGEVTRNLLPGTRQTVRVRFSPAGLGTHTCFLDLGDVITPVRLTGLGIPRQVAWELEPPVFEPTGVGETSTGTLSFWNTGNVPIPYRIVIPDTCPDFEYRPVVSSVPPGSPRYISIKFRPTRPGSLSCTLDLGAVLPDVFLTGVAYPRPEEWSISPDSLHFSPIYIGDESHRTARILNSGGTTLDLEVGLATPDSIFVIEEGAGGVEILPGREHGLRVRYLPRTAGTDTSALLFGPNFPPLPIRGTALLRSFAVVFEPDTLGFGAVELGRRVAGTATVTNRGNQTLDLGPIIVSPHFVTHSRSANLGPGESTSFTIEFAPRTLGPVEGLVDLGHEMVPDLVCRGTGTADFAVEENRIGIYFDPGYASPAFHTSAPQEIVTAYLVLNRPSRTTGVAAWECAWELEGAAYLLGWGFEGEVINVGRDNNLVVGIGGAPLPWSEAVLLASCQVLVPHPDQAATLALEPVPLASLDGFMAWTPGDDPATLLPMLPVGDERTLAWINDPDHPPADDLPVPTRLLPNVPNPFNPGTKIRFELFEPDHVSLNIYDLKGRLVRQLVGETLGEGLHERTWLGRDDSGRQVPSGPYFVRMVTDGGHFTRKIMLLK